METLIVALILVAVIAGFYTRGKQTGSRAGYAAGRRHERRKARRLHHNKRATRSTGKSDTE
jgi:hypothetical protein